MEELIRSNETSVDAQGILVPRYTVEESNVESLPLGDSILSCCTPVRLLGSGSNGAVVQVILDLEQLRGLNIPADELTRLFPGKALSMVQLKPQRRSKAPVGPAKRILALKVSSHYWSDGAL